MPRALVSKNTYNTNTKTVRNAYSLLQKSHAPPSGCYIFKWCAKQWSRTTKARGNLRHWIGLDKFQPHFGQIDISFDRGRIGYEVCHKRLNRGSGQLEVYRSDYHPVQRFHRTFIHRSQNHRMLSRENIGNIKIFNKLGCDDVDQCLYTVTGPFRWTVVRCAWPQRTQNPLKERVFLR